MLLEIRESKCNICQEFQKETVQAMLPGDGDDNGSDYKSIEYLELDPTFAMDPSPGVATNL